MVLGAGALGKAARRRGVLAGPWRVGPARASFSEWEPGGRTKPCPPMSHCPTSAGVFFWFPMKCPIPEHLLCGTQVMRIWPCVQPPGPGPPGRGEQKRSWRARPLREQVSPLSELSSVTCLPGGTCRELSCLALSSPRCRGKERVVGPALGMLRFPGSRRASQRRKPSWPCWMDGPRCQPSPDPG